MGKLIVIEGLDGSGKATQTKLLNEALSQKGMQAMQVSFPNYESPSSSLIKMYLGGEFGNNPYDVNAYAASSFYCVDRYASYKTIWGDFYNKGGIVVSDRYTTSNAIHQCSKLPENQWQQFLSWLFTFEYEQVAIPRPDMVIYLDVEPDVSQCLMKERYRGDETKKDIHEKNVAYLQKSRLAAQYCAQQYNWKRISCTENGKMRTIEDIHNEIMQLIVAM